MPALICAKNRTIEKEKRMHCGIAANYYNSNKKKNVTEKCWILEIIYSEFQIQNSQAAKGY